MVLLIIFPIKHFPTAVTTMSATPEPAGTFDRSWLPQDPALSTGLQHRVEMPVSCWSFFFSILSGLSSAVLRRAPQIEQLPIASL